MAVVVDKPTDMALPRSLLPGEAMNSTGAMQFHLLDNVTGVLALGSFHGEFNMMQPAMLQGLHQLKAAGATKLIVDLVRLPHAQLRCTGLTNAADKQQWWYVRGPLGSPYADEPF